MEMNMHLNWKEIARATLNGAEITVTIQNNEIKARLTFAPKQGE